MVVKYHLEVYAARRLPKGGGYESRYRLLAATDADNGGTVLECSRKRRGARNLDRGYAIFLRLSCQLLLNPLDAVPVPFQVFFPKANPIVTTADSQHIPTQTPAHSPHNSVEFRKNCTFPVPFRSRLVRPYPDGLVL